MNSHLGSSGIIPNGHIIERSDFMNLDVDKAKQLLDVVTWLNSMFPLLKLPLETSEEALRVLLSDGTLLCNLLSRISPGYVLESQVGSSEQRLDNIRKFLLVIEEMGLPGFRVSDLEQGSMVVVLECLLTLRDHLNSDKCVSFLRKRWKSPEAENFEHKRGVQVDQVTCRQNSLKLREEGRKNVFESAFQRISPSPRAAELSTTHHVGHKFHEVFQLKQGRYSDLPAAKISEMLKSNSLDNAPTQSLLGVVNGILDESAERKNGEIPQRVACLLRRVVQEIERRISTQAEHIRNQNNLIKAREEKYQSRIKVLETLATGTSEETQIVMSQLQQIKTEKIKIEERKKLEEQDVAQLIKEKENNELAISALKDEVEMTRKTYEKRCRKLELEATEAKEELRKRLKSLEYLLMESRKRTKELEAASESKIQSWSEKEHIYHNFISFQIQALRDLKLTSVSIQKEVINSQQRWREEFNFLGTKLIGLADAAQNYHTVLAENRRLYNEVQDLKGNIRVYCRIRPFLRGETRKRTIIEYIGDNGELIIANPSKQGKDGHRAFKFDKVFSPTARQEEVFLDTQPLIRSVLDGFNVCIFAYGQTGSGKTYTMTGPENSSEEEWGVNYRALNDLFHISEKRRTTFMHEVGVQMVEIYNEQVRDLLTNDSSQKKLGILSTSQSNGLAVPDASMHSVKSTRDVVDLMDFGHMNRSVGATALNQRSSRSHSILTIHVRGTDLETGAVLRGSLHLVDLAGSERVDRSEVTGDRLKEAQHINKSLSALGDVIFALAQKSSHVPYRNSKLTQVLQSSLGGQAKTLMFVQLNPNIDSYTESVSTLKFAERVSGVELGAARSNKESKDVKELMDQVASLKDTIAMKDEEIERLQLLKGAQSPNVSNEKNRTNSSKHLSPTPTRKPSLGGPSSQSRRLLDGKFGPADKAAPDPDNCSDSSDKHSEEGSHQSMDDIRHQKFAGGETNQMFPADVELLGFNRVDSEGKLSDLSEGGLSIGVETDGSAGSTVELSHYPEGAIPLEGTERITTEHKAKVTAQIPRPPQRPMHASSIRQASKVSGKPLPSTRKITGIVASSSNKVPPKRWS